MFITPHFRDYEFWCKDGTPVPDLFSDNMLKVAYQLEIIRSALNEPVYINSAYRTISHNTAIGGASRSFHLYCMAVDIRCSGATPAQVFKVISKLIDQGKIIAGGLKQYSSFVHYDIRGTKVLF
jgi:uncharacterized protein YcbK (DUF882 family)